jgi:hypothetical protein
LKYASDVWRVVVTAITMLVYVGAAIASAVDRGPRQAFAVGMFIAMTIYAVLLLNGRDFTSGARNPNSNVEFAPIFTENYSVGNLPTTRVLARIHAKLQQEVWINRDTGEVFNYDPRPDNRPPNDAVRARYRSRELPPLALFMVIGHCLWALLLGYVGGRFARFVYVRRTRGRTPLAAESS